ncbi:MAG: rod shape-determining protein RodA [Armatimonadetes bacterium]|nr:rod shape-determining protein RodA [Armatimonadota bacterium]
MDRRLLRNFDYALLLAAIAIIAFGCLTIYSASKGGKLGLDRVQRQLIAVIIGMVLGVVVASIDTGMLQRISNKLYWFCLAMLTLLLLFGVAHKGVHRWFGYGAFRVQPSEFAKIILIVALAVFLVQRIEKIRTVQTFAQSFLYMMVPMLLIFKQPDLGTCLALMATWLFMLFVMGTDLKNILIFLAACCVLGFAVFHVHGVLKEYQKNRLVSFVDPTADPKGSGYHVRQSRIAVGSGQFVGKGLFKGTQSKLRFIPEQHTDFIFTVVGEELGFLGSVGLLFLYFILIWRGLHIMSSTEDPVARAIAAGVVGLFVFHITINIGMTLGIMPVTGVPLPMFSFGGSSMVSNLMAVGLLEGIGMRRHRIAF